MFSSISSRPRRVIPFKPTAQTVQPRKQNPLGYVRLIQLVAHFPLQLRGDDYFTAQFRVLREREETKLKQNAILRTDEGSVKLALEMAMQRYQQWVGQ